MSRPRFFAAILIAAFSSSTLSGAAAAQQSAADTAVKDPHEVQPERPTVATHAGTVAPGWLEVEIGGEHDRYSGGETALSFPANVKIGAGSHAQINLLASGLDRTQANPQARGLGDVTVGLKYRLLDDAPVLSDFAILPSVKFPSASASSGLGSGTTDVGLLLISSRSIGPADVDINIGATRHFGGDSGSPSISTLWTASAGLPLSGPVGLAAEVFGYPGTSGASGAKPIIAILAGPTWQPRKWLATDAGIIEPLTGPQPRAFYAGLVWNVGKLW
jgi:hypothetical protein